MANDANAVPKPILEGVIERGPKGHFVKGNPGPPPGRRKPKGVPNKIPRTVKESMTGAAARYGRDGKGADGMDGFWDGVAQRNPEFLAAAITKTCVPPAKETEPTSTGGSITVNVISVPPNHFKCPDGNFRPDLEARALWDEYNAKLKSEGTPLLIGHSPSPPEQGTVELEQQPQTIEPAAQPATPVVEVLKPLSERDRIMARARAMGYEPLPPRPHRNDW